MKPDCLHPYDKVAIVAPSGRVFEKELEQNLTILKKWNLTPVFGENLWKEYNNGYWYAGSDEERAADLQWALDAEEIKAIWCARGGYGAVHLLDKLNWNSFQKKPKWLIGYSDITALHQQINNLGIQSLHAVTVKCLNRTYTKETFESLKKALFEGKLNYSIEAKTWNQTGRVKAPLLGGNLSLIYSLRGTPTDLKGDDFILFIEDWCENWYHLDRMLMNLKHSALLGKLKGMLVGSFTRMDVEEENPDFNSDFDKTSYSLIHNFMKEYKIPIGFGFPAGHIGDNRALILGNEVEMTVTKEKLTLEFS